MKRSEINKALKNLEAMCEKYHFALPPFCHFTPEQWQDIGHNRNIWAKKRDAWQMPGI